MCHKPIRRPWLRATVHLIGPQVLFHELDDSRKYGALNERESEFDAAADETKSLSCLHSEKLGKFSMFTAY